MGHGDGQVNVSRGARRRNTVGLLGVALAAGLVLTACSSGSGESNSAQPQGQVNSNREQVAPAAAKPAARITIAPGPGAADVSPADPITVTVADGTIDTVTLTNPDGKQVAGQLSADKTSWVTAEALGYGKTYTWAGSAVGLDGKPATISGQFTTVKPKRTVRATVNTGDGGTFGIAMPIAITFDAAVTDKASAQKALKVETSVPTEGAWAWLDDRTVHYRPKTYWQPGTQVNVTAKLYGVRYGNGSFGKEDLTAHFTIGRSQVVQANAQTHRWVIYRDGKLVADYPASYGLDSDPGRVTKSGTHVVMGKAATYFMNNPAYDYENVEVKWAVRISNNGEFAHAAPWSVGQQGKRNVSHGCANLAPANAKAYYDSVLPGDPVEVTGTTQQLSARDGDYYDWAISWDKWLAKSAA
jgi:lipoprotein-anchoring transpeptidase ErfK/SrfK